MPAACQSAERRRASGSAAPAAPSMLLQQGERPAVKVHKSSRPVRQGVGGSAASTGGSATPSSVAELGASGAPERCEDRHIYAAPWRRLGRGKGRLAHMQIDFDFVTGQWHCRV